MYKKILACLTAAAMTLTGVPTSLPAAAAQPQADNYSVTVGNVRVQTLSDTLARVEVKGSKGFEDRKTFHVVNRDFNGVKPTVTTENGVTEITTPNYTVFVPENATSLDGVKIANAAGRIVWKYTSLPDSNQFLPDPGDTPNAWAMADNPRIVPAEWGYSPMPSDNTDNTDINGWDDDNQAPDMYIFLPKKDYKTLLKDFITLTGSSEMIPIKSFGLWHSRYHNYKDYEALALIDEYRAHGFPLDNFVVDTDWRVNASTGYDINTSSWPDMAGFLNKAHTEKHVNIMFNDHPEPQKGQHALGQDDLKYRNDNLNRLLNMGLDTWWFDRNWHTTVKSPFSGISKEAFGMYLYQDITMRNKPDKRPMIMGNVDGIDNGAFNRPANISTHRYSMQWTGDTGCSTDFLKQEIVNIVRSGVVTANPYLNSDAGGHNGIVSQKLHARWSQYAALSPLFRYHCTSGDNNDRIPWNYGKESEDTARMYTLMRYRLLPLYYNLSHENYMTGLPMTRRLDINYPQYAEAQDSTQYLLGDNILVAPIWQEGTVSRSVFIPDGRWIEVWSGNSYEGPQMVNLSYGQTKSPIFVRSGSITPLAENVSYIGEKDWSNIALDVHPSTKLNGTGTLYEDDGVSVGYKSGEHRTTDLETSFDSAAGETVINIGKANGSFDGSDSFASRTWKLRLHMPDDWGSIESATLDGSDILSDITVINKDSAAAPFAVSGGSADAKTAEFTFTKPLTEQSEIRVKFASPVDEKLPEYSENSADAEVSELPLISDVDLTAEGTDDWARFDAENGEIKTVSKDGADVIGEVTADSAPVSADAKINFTCLGSTSSSALAVENGSLNFNVNLKKADKNIKIYIAAQSAQGILSVTDGAKFAKSVKISSTAGIANKIVSVIANSETESTLNFKFEKTGGSGRICLYAAAVSDPKHNEISPVELTASIEKAPDRLKLSDDKNIDWVHLGLNGDYTALNRKADTFQMLPEPETEGNVMQVTDYHTAVTFAGGAPTASAGSSHNAIAIQGSVKLSVPASDTWRELKMYIGTWQDTNNVEIYDQAGSEVTKISFSAGDKAETRCLTVRFRADTDTALYVKCSRAGNGNGNISLAAYSLSDVAKTENITARLTEAPDAVNLTEYDDWKHFSHTSPNAVNTKTGVKTSAITKLTPLADSLLRGLDFKTKFTWTDGSPSSKAANSPNFAHSYSGLQLGYNLPAGEWDIDLYASAWRAKGFFEITDKDGNFVDSFLLESRKDGSEYGKLTVHCISDKPTSLTVRYIAARAYDGFAGNVGIAAAGVKCIKSGTDLTALNAAIAKAETVDAKLYTAESIQALADALTAAKAVTADALISQTDADKAAADLTAAINALIKIEIKPEPKPDDDKKPDVQKPGSTVKPAKVKAPAKLRKFTAKKKGRKITLTIKKSASKNKTYIEYRKGNKGKFKKLTITAKTKFTKKFKKGKYQFRAYSYIKVDKKAYKSKKYRTVKVTVK